MINEQFKQDIKKKIDLLALVGEYVELQYKATTNGGEYAGPCPKCRGTDRFLVWPSPIEGHPRFWCRDEGNGNGCGFKGDCFSFVQGVENLPFAEAVQYCAEIARLVVQTTEPRMLRPKLKPRSTSNPGKFRAATPPSSAWQQAGWQFVDDCQKLLWSEAHTDALDYLINERKLKVETIKKAGIGYNPQGTWHPKKYWGIVDSKVKKIWLPRGWVIPWVIRGELWRINIRRPDKDLGDDDAKMIGPKGFSATGLYQAENIDYNKPIVLVEGEITALTVKQEAGDFVVAVATGSTGHARCHKWLTRLSLCPLVLISFDNDEPGEKASEWWVTHLSNAIRWRPPFGDANDLLEAGISVRGWIEAGLKSASYQPSESRWVYPEVTRHFLQTLQAMGNPPDIWPYALYNDARGIWVKFGNVEELKAATRKVPGELAFFDSPGNRLQFLN
ncbi:MAG: hypothetical protein KDJ52_08545 [Anaerolineae bacterium]|nr:hypothetical protein [Anaerolineae bacterium]